MICCRSKFPFQSLAFFATILYIMICSTKPQNIRFRQAKKFIIGGLFPVHFKGSSNSSNACGPISLEKGIQRLEAMLFAVDQINRNESFWKFNLETIVVDTCSSDTYALEQSLQFLQTSCKFESDSKKVTGVVGAANSDVSAALASIFKPFKIPQISYASTSEKLNDLNKYPYFFRVVPSDKFQVRVILDILSEFKWSYISAVASEDDYGKSAIENIQKSIENTSLPYYEEICFAEILTIPSDAEDEHYDWAMSALLQHENVKVVVVFLHQDKVKKLLSAFKRSNAPLNRFVWLGSDAWGAKLQPVRGNEGYAVGAITILPKRFPISAGFDEYFLSLTPEGNTRNPWFKEFWEAQFHCVFNENSENKCTGKENLASEYRQEGFVPMVIDAVYVLATAIKSLCKDYPKLCRDAENKDLEFRKRLKDYIEKVNVASVQGNGIELSFDSNRDIEAKYNIYQYQRISNSRSSFDYKLIGEWVNGNSTRVNKLSITQSPIWEGNQEITSFCGKECNIGEERIYSRNRKRRCCWVCRRCKEDFYLPDRRGNCQKCSEGRVPTTDMRECTDMELKYIGKDILSPWALTPLSFSILGLLCTFTIFIIFLYFRNTPIIMASGRELCYVILIGVALCYCFTFFAISRPSKFMCSALRIGMGLGISVCYSAIITKTSRTSRIFNRSLRTAKRPSYISPESQLVICLCLILIQITLSAMWLFIKPPSTETKFIEVAPAEWILKCGFDKMSVLFGLLYNMVLLLFCTFYAFKTRNIPENFNESKYISFTMYSSCIIWLAFIPIYCSALDDYKVQITVLAMSVSLSGSVTLVCIFLPKIYVVIFRPDKNVRYPSSNTNSGATATYITPAPILFKRAAKTNHTQAASEDFQNDLLANKSSNHPYGDKK